MGTWTACGGGVATEYLRGMTGYTDILAQAGYACGLSGKWHMGDSINPQKGFTSWFAHSGGGGPYYGAPLIRDGAVYEEERYVSDAFTDETLAFIDAQKDTDNPFYLSLHFTAPHSPWAPEHHPGEILDLYKDCPFESCPDVEVHPWQINTAPGGKGAQRREALTGYFAAVTAMDINVGRILDKLEAEGLREDTLIFFTSDNGMNMGHHGIFGKGNGTYPQNMYDSSVKVPALISHPGNIPEGVVEEGLCSHYDFMPTILEYAGLENPEADKLPGKSFAPLLRGESMESRENVVVHDEYGPVRMIRNKEWKYVHRYPYGPHELYHLAEDPDETKNLAYDDDHADTLEAMKADLDKFFVRYADPTLDGTREAVYGKGQMGRAGLGAKGKKVFSDNYFYVDENHKRRPDGYQPF